MERKYRKLPKDETELQDREAQGLWRAIALAKKVGEGEEKISLDVILHIHKTMLVEAIPNVAGRFRMDGEDIKKLRSHEPPPGRVVIEQMHVFWREFDTRLAKISRRPKKQTKTQRRMWFGDIIGLGAWVHHQISYIHPFCDGNGRMARLMTNVILSRFGLPPTRVKYEGENKEAYLQALCRIDLHGDYESLKQLIARSVLEGYKREEVLRKRNR